MNVIDYGFRASEVTTYRRFTNSIISFWTHKHKAAGVSTRSQAVARIPDRTASQHLWGHVTPKVSLCAISCWWSFGTKPLSLTVSEIFNVECNAMVDMTLIRPLNKDPGHSFWYQSISHIIRLPIGCQ